jgi:hypothetical protein
VYALKKSVVQPAGDAFAVTEALFETAAYPGCHLLTAFRPAQEPAIQTECFASPVVGVRQDSNEEYIDAMTSILLFFFIETTT